MKVNGEAFLAILTADQWKSLIGLNQEMFNYIFNRFCVKLPLINNTRWSWFQLFYWMKIYPPWRSMISLNGLEKSSSESSCLHRLYLLEAAMKKDDIIGEMWKKRNEHESPCDQYFDGHITGYIDSVPITVQRSKNSDIQSKTYVPKKYARHIVKFQFVVGHTGIPIFISGPHNGTASDIEIWRQRGCGAIMEDEERFLADKGYIGENKHLIVPFKEYKNRPLTRTQKNHNIVLGWFRAGVEHFFGHLKRWQILGSRYRGRLSKSVAPLRAAVYVLSTVLAIRHELRPLRMHVPLTIPHENDKNNDVIEKESKEIKQQFNIDNLQMGYYDLDVMKRGEVAVGTGPEPSDVGIDTGMRKADFKKNGLIVAWWWGKWWHATVRYIPKAAGETVTIRFRWSKVDTTNYKTRLLFPKQWK